MEFSGHGFKSHPRQLSAATSKNPSVMNTICITSFRYTDVITSTKLRLKHTWRLTKAIAEMKCDTEQTMKLQELYKVCSEYELNSWPDSSVGWSVWTELTGRSFKFHSRQLSIVTSENPSVMNTISINSFRHTYVITSTKLRLKQTLRLTKAIAEMKCDTEETMKLE